MGGYRVATHCPWGHPYSGTNLRMYEMRRGNKVYPHKICLYCRLCTGRATRAGITLATYYALNPVARIGPFPRSDEHLGHVQP